MKKYGAGISFLIGLLVGGIGNILLALIVWLIARDKLNNLWYWAGAIVIILIVIILLGVAFFIGLFGVLGSVAQSLM